jgi:hypothetical protein
MRGQRLAEFPRQKILDRMVRHDTGGGDKPQKVQIEHLTRSGTQFLPECHVETGLKLSRSIILNDPAHDIMLLCDPPGGRRPCSCVWQHARPSHPYKFRPSGGRAIDAVGREVTEMICSIVNEGSSVNAAISSAQLHSRRSSLGTCVNDCDSGYQPQPSRCFGGPHP